MVNGSCGQRLRVIFFAIFFGVIFFSPILSGENIAEAAILPSSITELVNKERESQNLSRLIMNPSLNDAAQAKALDMASSGYFAHTSPEGKTPWYWLGQAGYKYQYAGENLAVNFTESKSVVRGWMESPTHRANILKANYTEVGTGIATGYYEGKQTIFVVQVYGNPLPTTISSVKNSPPPKIPAKIATAVSKKVKEPVVKPVIKKENTEVLGVETAIAQAVPAVFPKAVAHPANNTNFLTTITVSLTTFALFIYALLRVRNIIRLQ